MNSLTQKLAAVGFGLSLVAAPAMAKHERPAYCPEHNQYHEHRRDRDDGDRHRRSSMVRARVIAARPITKEVQHKRPYEVCEYVPRHRYDRHRQNHHRGDHWKRTEHHQGEKIGSAVLGAVLGGVIGHQFGSGRGNDAATVAGAAMGAHLGYQNARHVNRPYHEHRRGRKECRTEYEYYTTHKTVGYKVKYRYNREVFRTRTKHHPGKWIDIEVAHRPRRHR